MLQHMHAVLVLKERETKDEGEKGMGAGTLQNKLTDNRHVKRKNQNKQKSNDNNTRARKTDKTSERETETEVHTEKEREKQ